MQIIEFSQALLIFIVGLVVTYFGYQYSKTNEKEPVYKRYSIIAFGVILCLMSIASVVLIYVYDNSPNNTTNNKELDELKACANRIKSKPSPLPSNKYYIKWYGNSCITDNDTNYIVKKCDKDDLNQVFTSTPDSQIKNVKTEKCIGGTTSPVPTVCSNTNDQTYLMYDDYTIRDKDDKCFWKNIHPKDNEYIQNNVIGKTLCTNSETYKWYLDYPTIRFVTLPYPYPGSFT